MILIMEAFPPESCREDAGGFIGGKHSGVFVDGIGLERFPIAWTHHSASGFQCAFSPNSVASP